MRFQRNRDGLIHRHRPGESPEVAVPAELGRKLEAFDREDSGVRTAKVHLRTVSREEPVRFRGAVTGFHEVLEAPEPGELQVDHEELRFVPSGVGKVLRWPLLTLRSLQASSSSIQVRPPGMELASFRFDSDSPRRWEQLLARRLRKAWIRAGRGEIVELQPRIVAEGDVRGSESDVASAGGRACDGREAEVDR